MLTQCLAVPKAMNVARDIYLVRLVPKIHYRSMVVSMVELHHIIEQHQPPQLQHPQRAHVSSLLHHR
jgi:hypothetical protein